MRVPGPDRTAGSRCSRPDSIRIVTGASGDTSTPPTEARSRVSVAPALIDVTSARRPSIRASPPRTTRTSSGEPFRTVPPWRFRSATVTLRSAGSPSPSPTRPFSDTPRPGASIDRSAPSPFMSARAVRSPIGIPRASSDVARTSNVPRGASSVPSIEPRSEAVPARGTPCVRTDRGARSRSFPSISRRGTPLPSSGTQVAPWYGRRPFTVIAPSPWVSVNGCISMRSGVNSRSPCSDSKSMPATLTGEISTRACPVGPAGRPVSEMRPVTRPVSGARMPITSSTGASGNAEAVPSSRIAPSP